MDKLLNDESELDLHQDTMSKFTGMQNSYTGSNFDNLMKVLDHSTFTTRQNLDEMNKAHAINYAHGLELDDIGDDYHIERNGYDDDMYRFFINAREMARKSNGTLNDLIHACANLLGCNYSDVYMTRDRHYDNGQLVGDPKTIKVVDIPYNKVKNFFVLDHLADELKRSAADGTQIKFISFALQTNLALSASNYNLLSSYISVNIDNFTIKSSFNTSAEAYSSVHTTIQS